ncbi:MAG: tetratricopeptide repeat protein [Chitinophagaceae bacterium]
MRKASCRLCVLLVFSASVAAGQNLKTDSLLLQLKKTKEDTSKVTLYRNLGISIVHQDPHKAIEYWKEGVSLGKKLNFTEGLARCYVNISAGFAFAAQYDSALIYSDTAIIYAHRVGDVNRLALVYLNRADSYIRIQNFTQALTDCNLAMKYAEQANNKDRLARIYHNISDIYSAQDQFTPAIEYLDKAVQLYRQLENIQMTGLATYDMASIYRKMNDPQKAIDGYKAAIHIADSIEDFKNLSAYYTDLCEVYISLNRLKDAEQLAPKAMQYAIEPENLLQQAIVHSMYCNLYLKQGKAQQAVSAGLQAYKMSQDEEDLLWQQKNASLLAEAYRLSGNNNKAYNYLAISNTLNDSLLKQRFNEQTANLQTKFQVGQKDKEILLLNKDKQLQQQQLKQQRFLLFTSIAIALLALLGIFLLINRYRLRQRMKELELRNRIAADLHDEVGSSLSSIHLLSLMASQQAGDDAPEKNILSRMSNDAKETVDKMSDIVWMIKSGDSEGSSLKHRMERFAYEMAGSLNIHSSINLDDLEKTNLSMEKQKNIYLIFKEALNNAVKYSGTEKLEVRATVENKELKLLLRDYGKGFHLPAGSGGNGLGNMNNRAKELKGTLHIDSTAGNGTRIELIVPL